MKIRLKILLITGIIIISVVFVYSILSITITNSRVSREIKKQLNDVALEKIDGLDRFMSERLSDIEIIVNDPTMKSENASLEEKMQYLRDYEKYSKRYISMSIYDNSGIKIGDTRSVDIGENESQKEFVSKALNGEIYFDPYPIYSDYLNAYTFHFSGPLIDSAGNIFGAVVTRFPTTRINDLLAGSNLNPETNFSADLISKDGIVIYSNHDRESISKELGGNLKILDEFKKDPNLDIATSTEKEYENKKQLFIGVKEKGFLDYAGQSWILLLHWDTSELFGSLLWSVILEYASVSLFFLIILLPLARYYANSFSKPILQLNEAAKYVQKRNFDHPVNIKTKDEIGIFGQTFNSMLKQLKSLYSEMENRIKSKTKELSDKVALIEQKNIDLENTKKATLNLLEDIQNEKNTSEAEKNKMEIILGSIGDGVFVVDNQEKIIVFNKTAEQISGFTASDVLGKSYRNVMKFIIEKNININDDFIKKTLESGELQSMSDHTVLYKKDGKKIPIADSAAPLVSKEGKIVGCVVVFRDVTREREIDQMKSEFVSVASHQLRTPLTSIKWLLEMMLEGDVGKITKKQEKHLKDVFASNERMIVLVNDLLNVSRIEAGKIKIEPKEVQIEDILTEIAETLKPMAQKKNITMVCHHPKPKLPKLFIDPERISEAFKNVISNAIKYTKDGGKIELSCKQKDQVAEFAVKDNGVGIPKDQQKRIYEKFFRADNIIRMQTEGTGLGLYITKSIIESSGGKMRFESEEGKGTTFYLTLPIKKT